MKDIEDLPKLKNSILKTTHLVKANNINISNINKLNTSYAKDYSIWLDFKTVFLHLHLIGTNTNA